jgi:hypothetical protein
MMTARTRLDSVSPELADRLRGSSEDALHRVAAVVSDLAVTMGSLSDPRVDSALAVLGGGPASGEEKAELQVLVDELDEAAWEIQERVHSGRLPEHEYLQAFRKARAASAVAFALDPDPQTAAMEAVYEAQSAAGDINPVRAAVLEILGS